MIYSDPFHVLVKNKLVYHYIWFLKSDQKVFPKGFLNQVILCDTELEFEQVIDLLKKINIYHYFEYVAGGNTFDYCKPDPRHLTSIIEIIDGKLDKCLMFGDSENDADAARAANIPMILLEDGYTDKKIEQIYHNHLISDFVNVEKIVSKYLDV